MILLIDVGNTRLKWACVEAGEWRAQGALPTAEVAGLAEVLASHDPAWVGVCCVAGAAVRAAIEAMLAGRSAHWLAPVRAGHGISNRYARPDSLGADRYAALIACLRRGDAPCVVLGAGTAVTVDALTGDGEFLGGMILPGVVLMRRALAGGTAGVPEAPGHWHEFPRATGDAVTTGVITAVTGAAEAMRRRLGSRLGRTVPVIVTGGDAALLADHLAAPATIVSNLVLEGLLWLARDLGVSDA